MKILLLQQKKPPFGDMNATDEDIIIAATKASLWRYECDR